MAEDEESKPVEAAALTSQPAPPAVEPLVEVPATTGAVDAVAAAPTPSATPAEPPNKLYEWGAAVGIMMFLVLVLWFFLNFLRSTSL